MFLDIMGLSSLSPSQFFRSCEEGGSRSSTSKQRPTTSTTNTRTRRSSPSSCRRPTSCRFLCLAAVSTLCLVEGAAATDPVLGSPGDSRTLCAPAVLRTPLQKLELQLSWPAASTTSGYKKLRESLGFFAGAGGSGGASSSVPFHIIGNPVRKGLLCQFLHTHAHHYVTKLLAPLMCEDCSNGCAPPCVPYMQYGKTTSKDGKADSVAETDDDLLESGGVKKDSGEMRYACEINSPTQCLFLETPTGASLPADLKANWIVQVDGMRVILLFAGIFCTLFYKPLGRSAIVHTVLGGLMGLGLFVAIVAYYMLKQAKNAVPGGNRTFAMVNVLMVVTPTVGMYLYQTFAPSFAMLAQMVTTVAQLKDPYYEFPVGAVFLGIAVLGGVWLGQKVFGSSAMEEISGDVPFFIAPNGARVDMVPDEDSTNAARRILQYCIYAFGIISVLRSTTVPLMNLTILGILLAGNTVVHFLWTWQMARQSNSNPVGRTEFISQAEMQKRSKENTQRELEKLRAFLASRDGKKHITNVRNSNTELRVRQFVDGGNHVDSNLLVDDDDETDKPWWKFW
ncbi:unnamed protein product [Amoebophrya sp. A25]|nr:unnamed protein product [Amoebophrya sp. A25]|eukprot:GSA25T00009703001.1